MKRTLFASCLAALVLPWPVAALAQDVDRVATAPPNLLLANYDSVPVGPFGGLEGSAYVARVGDPSAAWFNPAGLSRQRTAQISGSAGVYQRISVAPRALPNSGGSIQQLPNFVGLTFNVRGGLTAGAAVLTTTAWMQETDSELILTREAGNERLALSADSEFTRRIAAAGLGYRGAGGWSVGGGLSLSMMDLRLVQSISDRLADNTTLSTLMVTARAAGSAMQLRTQAGVQYDTAHLRFGLAMRSPGLSIMRSGTVTLDGVLDRGAASVGASIFDPDARMEYHQPWEFQGGAGYVTPSVRARARHSGLHRDRVVSDVVDAAANADLFQRRRRHPAERDLPSLRWTDLSLRWRRQRGRRWPFPGPAQSRPSCSWQFRHQPIASRG